MRTSACPSGPDATSTPPYVPASPAAGSTVTDTGAVPCGGTVTRVAPSRSGIAESETTARSSTSGASPSLRYTTVRSTGSVLGQRRYVDSAAGLADTVRVTAAATSTRPVPCSNTPMSGPGAVEPTSASLIRSPVQSGCCWARIAAAPATCGVAIEVPPSRV